MGILSQCRRLRRLTMFADQPFDNDDHSCFAPLEGSYLPIYTPDGNLLDIRKSSMSQIDSTSNAGSFDPIVSAAHNFLKRLVSTKRGVPYETLVLHIANCPQSYHRFVMDHMQDSLIKVFTFNGVFSNEEPIIEVVNLYK